MFLWVSLKKSNCLFLPKCNNSDQFTSHNKLGKVDSKFK